MTPSRILSLFDPMLPYETVRMCLSAYLGSKETESAVNPLISPVVASDEILSKFPHTTLVAAQVCSLFPMVVLFTDVCDGCVRHRFLILYQLDPLLDDSTLMARRLHGLGVPVSCAFAGSCSALAPYIMKQRFS